jgi:hypothetical protein
VTGPGDPLLGLLPAWVRPLLGDAPAEVVALEQGLEPRTVRTTRRKTRVLLQRLETIARARGLTPSDLVRLHAAVAARPEAQRRASHGRSDHVRERA